MKLFVVSTLPETLLSLIILETEADKIVIATNLRASKRLDELGIYHELVNVETHYNHAERDTSGYSIAENINGSLDGYSLANGLYPDRLRFWFMPSVIESESLLNGLDFQSVSKIYIESNLNDYLSWLVAKKAIVENAKIKIVLVKSDQNIYSPEFRYIDYLPFDEIVVPHDRDVQWLRSITKKPVSKIEHVIWENPTRPLPHSADIEKLRSQLNIPNNLHVTGIVYLPQDDWKLLAYFREYKPTNYVLFFNAVDRDRFVKSVPESIRNGAMFRFDDLTMAEICNEVLFPRYIPACDRLPKNINLTFYDLNNTAFSKELTEEGLL